MLKYIQLLVLQQEKPFLLPWLSQTAFKILMNFFCRNLLRSAFLMLCSRHPWMQISQLKHSGKQKRRCKHLSKPRTEENLRLHLIGFDETYSQRWRDFRLLRNFLEAIIHWELVYDHVHTVVLKWITNKDLLSSTGNSAQCHVAAWMEGSLGEKGYINLYGWIPHLHTTIQNELNKKITENQSINHWDLLS